MENTGKRGITLLYYKANSKFFPKKTSALGEAWYTIQPIGITPTRVTHGEMRALNQKHVAVAPEQGIALFSASPTASN
ncbi:hypothetical protein CSA80_03645 [Candidatus Saccharibacteria bacterium]|nr:MAG: hypothetical protein CR973_01135 [Candidatus Saccharibacteria bacterium]PID99181.1 MAG: hypothetical protein CSA80_03645 [Candidatus Saccharibacteria bacterium]